MMPTAIIKQSLPLQFWKDHDGSVDVAAGMAPDFTAKLTKAGIYHASLSLF